MKHPLNILVVAILSFITIAATPYNTHKLDVLLQDGISQHIFPGAVVLISHKGHIVYHKAHGRYTYDTSSPVITTETLFDIASLTKVVVTATMAMMLHDTGRLALMQPAATYLNEWDDTVHRPILIHHLLTHTSGICEALVTESTLPTILWQQMLAYPLEPVGSVYRYTCTNMVLLQTIIERLTQTPLDRLAQHHIFKPLGMHNTMFKPEDRTRCAPTCSGAYRGIYIQGEVHDWRASCFGGVCGNAGLFSTASDLALFMDMMMSYGRTTSKEQLICAETVRTWTQQCCAFKRGYGWEIGRHLSPKSFGHFGWTGTSIWADRDQELFCILLTNRTYENTDPARMRAFREAFHEAVVRVLREHGE